MKITLKTAVIFLLFPFSLMGQEKDTAKNTKQTLLSSSFYTDSTNQEIYNFAKQSSYYLMDLMPDHVSKASLQYIYQKGNFVPSQGATTINAINASTEGTTKLGTIKLFGGFSYQKTFEDSTRFAHQTRSNLSTPYYFGSPAYVHYERSVYTFNAMATKFFFNDKLNMGIGTDYKVGDHYSTNDPRGSVGEYQLNLQFSLGYKVNKSFSFGAAYRTGYGQERVTVGYKNPRYYESSFYPMYYNHLINGYGEGRPALSSNNRRYSDDQKRNGADLYLDFKTENLGHYHLKASHLKESQHYFYGSGSGFEDFAQYDLTNTDLKFLWYKTYGKYTLGTLIDYNNNAGKDFNIQYAANNYRYNVETLSAKVFLSKNGIKNTYNHFLKITQYSEERVDGVKANDIYFSNLYLNIGSGFTHFQGKQHFLSINLSAEYKLPLNDQFQVTQANEGYFTRYVIYHDYLYNTASYFGGKVTAEYGFPFLKTMQAGFKIDLGYNNKLDQKALERNIVSEPGKDRFSSNISLNLYF
ncbi:DUF6850 family outer membrane beta-barrel protein [Pedobacter nototheniae]|uniref:DUF6850 family outer membrane beta-barrel protein n=1 Tax=Pedobacter nototheniae TaxID=2488994 RepID=UPI002930435B|nr:DUF6850 family outer membrane beta-barrel protein [Pedobacter nototheniae]